MVKLISSLMAFVLAININSWLVVSRSLNGGKCWLKTKDTFTKPECGWCGKHAKSAQNQRDASYYQYSRSKRSADIPPEKFIYAGEATGIAQYPWLVRVTTKFSNEEEVYLRDGKTLTFLGVTNITKVFGCAGSLVSPRHVITAAHCLNKKIMSYEDITVTLAEYNTETYPRDCAGSDCVMNLSLHPENVYIHDNYQDNGIYYNDIAILRLGATTPYTDFIRPICLPPFNINQAKSEGKLLTITGWGETETSSLSPIKMHTQVRLVAPETCRKDYSTLTDGQLCAAGRKGQDVCRGDSGGPIMMEHNGSFFLVGVVSSKRSDSACGSSVSSKYTNVFFYMKWIQNIIEE